MNSIYFKNRFHTAHAPEDRSWMKCFFSVNSDQYFNKIKPGILIKVHQFWENKRTNSTIQFWGF